MSHIGSIVFDFWTSVSNRAENLMIEYFSDTFLRDKDYDILKAIFEAFIVAYNKDINGKNIFLKNSIYKYIDKAHPELIEEYYKGNTAWLHWYIRLTIQKYTKGMSSYTWKHIFSSLWIWIWKYVLKDLLPEKSIEQASTNSTCVVESLDLNLNEFENRVNKIIRWMSQYELYSVRFEVLNEELYVSNSRIEKGKIIIRLNLDGSYLKQNQKKFYKITDDFIVYLSSEIAIQIVNKITHWSLIWYKTEYLTRILMKTFNDFRVALSPLKNLRLIIVE